MRKSKLVRLTRQWHRYLGAFLGIQFLLWTLGGLYFSWTNIDKIRGDNLKNEKPYLSNKATYLSPSDFLLKHLKQSDSLISLELTTILEEPIYRLQFTNEGKNEVLLINAENGKLRKPLNEQEAIKVANNKLNIEATVTDIEYLIKTGNHHEYRGRPLPAYAITYGNPANTTVYISKKYGNVQTFRSNQWRVFDFLWMLHTMDYQERDNFNNIVLRAFSLFGIFTILSGFTLYVLTSKTLNKKRKP
ncbi:PepSY domain-containing protein [Aquimarina mytili]|uniref:PepSY domain-containing protein n=1 Tax=Aquimarina mytili TaxID=874423 RepID=A0A937A030_9FLAO|nr:PepSY domain-containing protein [Aquimarina mytili]MBL0684346.1 PepSY domain-containing protein [Aquimarina mytili]